MDILDNRIKVAQISLGFIRVAIVAPLSIVLFWKSLNGIPFSNIIKQSQNDHYGIEPSTYKEEDKKSF